MAVPAAADTHQQLTLAQLLHPALGQKSYDIAGRLLAHCGSISAIGNIALPTLTRLLDGDERLAELLITARDIHLAGLREDMSRERVVPGARAMMEYLVRTIGGATTEKVFAIFADRNGGFIADGIIAEGKRDTVALSARALFSRALMLDSASVVLAHNHPSGAARASDQDIRVTHSVARQCAALGITLLDHVIITGRDAFSMHRGGLL